MSWRGPTDPTTGGDPVDPAYRPRHRAEPIPLVVQVAGARAVWRPPLTPGQAGTLTANRNLRGSYDNAVRNEQVVPVLGRLVVASDRTEHGALAALASHASGQVHLEQHSPDLTEFLASLQPGPAVDPAQLRRRSMQEDPGSDPEPLLAAGLNAEDSLTVRTDVSTHPGVHRAGSPETRT